MKRMLAVVAGIALLALWGALHELAETAARLNRWEFMLTVEPLRVERGAGSPVNPIAVF